MMHAVASFQDAKEAASAAHSALLEADAYKGQITQATREAENARLSAIAASNAASGAPASLTSCRTSRCCLLRVHGRNQRLTPPSLYQIIYFRQVRQKTEPNHLGADGRISKAVG